MASWSGAARSNWVRVADLEGLKKSLDNWSISVQEDGDGRVAFFSTVGGWPSFSEDETGDEIEFTFSEVVMPYIAEGEVLVVMEAGYERLRYLTGVAAAFVRRGDTVENKVVELFDIYEKAASAFAVPVAQINRAEG